MHERIALNDIIKGMDRSSFEEKHLGLSDGNFQGPWHRNHSLIPARFADRLAAYDRVQADLPAALDRFAVRYVALPVGTRPDYLARGWIPIATGPTWDVWERTATSRP